MTFKLFEPIKGTKFSEHKEKIMVAIMRNEGEKK